jgi:phosphoribosylanthranilate isomerase
MLPFVKVCGVCRLQDALLAAECGAAAVGFVFWRESPRFIDPYRARRIAQALPPFVATVGVFVDQPAEHVSGVARLLNLSAIQLHGEEGPAPFLRTGYRVIKAVPVTAETTTAVVDTIPAEVTVLLDANDPVKRGGTGRTIDWSLAAHVAASRRTILSGGLTPGNVRAAVEHVGPYAIDVSSGVESAPGVKDETKLRAFFDALAGDWLP